jgi:hypothetical protein
MDMAMKELKARMMTTAEYDEMFSRWATQIVIYDKMQMYVELSR